MDKLSGVIQNYAWGSHTAIPELLGIPAGDEPVAEYWLGGHRSAPSVTSSGPLDDRLDREPALVGATSVERFGARLPFLLKLLAAERPLSLQAHPTRAQAESGFARENEAGVALDAPERTYRDDWPKPEALVALTEFDALCGFRNPAETMALFDGLGEIPGLAALLRPLEERSGEAALAEVFLDTLSLDADHREIVEQVVAKAVNLQSAPEPLGSFARTAVEIDAHFPADPGILAALLLNRVTLQPGEAIFLDAGIMHAYLKGTGVEIMANSDNVLRGGLTNKHIDVDQLVSVVSFVPSAPPLVETEEISPGVLRYLTPAPEFALYRMDTTQGHDAALPGEGGRIALVTAGSVLLRCGEDEIRLIQGEAAFLAAAETGVTVSGTGQVFIAAPGV